MSALRSSWMLLALLAMSLAFTPGCDDDDDDHPTASLTVINDTSSTDIVYVYVSHTSSDFWGEDHLGDQVIAPGEELTIAGIRHGTYDLRAETWGNVELVERYGVTIDSDMNWTLYDSGSAETTADTVATTTNAPAAAITAGEFEPTGAPKRETAQPVDASVF